MLSYLFCMGAGELDLLFFTNGKWYGIEAKVSEAPEATRSMQVALHDLGLEHLWVIHPGEQSHSVHEHMTVWPLQSVSDLAQLLTP
jgi:hypothetical protein